MFDIKIQRESIQQYQQIKLKMDKQLVEQLNFRVLSKQVKNLQKIIFTIPYSVLATYDQITTMWTYLKYKGPLFLVEDKLKHKKLIILNQMATKNDFILPILESYKFQLKQLGPAGGFMLNFGVEDSISGWIIKGIWSQDENMKEVFKYLTEGNK